MAWRRNPKRAVPLHLPKNGEKLGICGMYDGESQRTGLFILEVDEHRIGKRGDRHSRHCQQGLLEVERLCQKS